MKIEDLNQIRAKLDTATTPEAVKEAFANVTVFAQEIMKASEEYSRAADKAKTEKEEADKTVAAMKSELVEAKKTLQELKDAKAANEAEAAFQSRMTVMASEVEMDDEARAFVVEDVRACADDASFAKYLTKAKKLMKAKTNSKTADDEHGKQGKGIPGKTGKNTVDTQNDAATAAAQLAIASALANPTDTLDIDPIAGAVANVSIHDQYKAAFASGITIGSRSLKDFSSETSKTATTV